MTAWLVSPLIIESSHRILIAAAACRFHLDYVNWLIMLSYITLLHSLLSGGFAKFDVITAFRQWSIIEGFFRQS
jgi:hypothetical protein